MDERIAKMNGNTQAFPNNPDCQQGMTLREWLAGMALQGILASSQKILEMNISVEITAVKYADRLLIELERKPQ